MRGDGAGSQIVVALPLVAAHRADALNVAKDRQLRPCENTSVDPEYLKQAGEFVGGTRSLTNQFVEIVGGNLKIAGDPAKLDLVELAHFVQLAAVLTPVGE